MPVFCLLKHHFNIYYSTLISGIQEAQKCDKQLATTASSGLDISCGCTLGLCVGSAIKVGSPSFGVVARLFYWLVWDLRRAREREKGCC
jgi:hypothetical protein